MTPTLDISTDFATVTDGLDAVSVDGTSVTSALRRAITTKEAAQSSGKYLTSDTIFHLDLSEHPQRPTIGGQIVDTDGNWTILEVAKQTLSNRWRCICRQLYLDPALTVTIQKATYVKGASGAQEPTWADEAVDIPAKVSIDNDLADAEHSDRTTRRLATVYFASPQSLTPQHRIIGPSGEILKVISWSGYDAIAQLFSVQCEVMKWPKS